MEPSYIGSDFPPHYEMVPSVSHRWSSLGLSQGVKGQGVKGRSRGSPETQSVVSEDN